MSITQLDKQYVAPTYGRFPLELVSGKGSIAYGSDGKEYIDLGSGIGVTAFGYCDDQWQKAVNKQASTLQHTSNLYYTEPCAKLAEALCLKTGLKKVFFSNSGAEANECAIKVARKYSAEKKGEDHYTVITLVNSFHGRTLTTLSATGQDKFHALFNPLTPGFAHCKANDCDELKKLVDEVKPAGIMLECVQGEGGVIALDEDFIKCAYDLAQENDIPLIIDEVQTGNGRTGTLYAYQQYGIMPDIVSTAKGIGGGLPLGATMLGEKLADVYTPGTHGSTFGGNPVSCAGAISILSRIDDELLAGVRERNEYIVNALTDAKGVGSVSGMGLMLGILTEKPAKDVIAGCMARGVVVLSAKDKVRLLPALNIPMDQLKAAIEILKEVIAE